MLCASSFKVNWTVSHTRRANSLVHVHMYCCLELSQNGKNLYWWYTCILCVRMFSFFLYFLSMFTLRNFYAPFTFFFFQSRGIGHTTCFVIIHLSSTRELWFQSEYYELIFFARKEIFQFGIRTIERVLILIERILPESSLMPNCSRSINLFSLFLSLHSRNSNIQLVREFQFQ